MEGEESLLLLPGVALTSTQVRMVSAPSLTCVTSNGYFPAAVSLPVVKGGGLKIHCTQVCMGSNPIADMSGWSHGAKKESLLCRLGWL